MKQEILWQYGSQDSKVVYRSVFLCFIWQLFYVSVLCNEWSRKLYNQRFLTQVNNFMHFSLALLASNLIYVGFKVSASTSQFVITCGSYLQTVLNQINWPSNFSCSMGNNHSYSHSYLPIPKQVSFTCWLVPCLTWLSDCSSMHTLCAIVPTQASASPSSCLVFPSP